MIEKSAPDPMDDSTRASARSRGLAREACRLASAGDAESLREASFRVRQILALFENPLALSADPQLADRVRGALSAGLRDQESFSRAAAVSALRGCLDDRSEKELCATLSDPFAGRNERSACAEALEGRHGDEPRAALISALQSRDGMLMRACARSLAGCGDAAAEQALVQALARSRQMRRSRGVELEIGEALRGCRSPDVLERLVQSTPAEEGRWLALTGVSDDRTVDALIERCRKGGETIRLQCVRALGPGRHARAQALLVELATEPASTPATRSVASACAAELQGSTDEATLVALAGAVSGESMIERARRLSAHIIPGLYEPGRPGDAARARCISALTGSSHPAALDALLWSLRHPGAVFRREAAKALAGCGGERARAGLIRALSDGDAAVRSYAAESLRDQAARPEVREVLAERLRDSDDMVRVMAARLLRGVLMGVADRQHKDALTAGLLECLRRARTVKSSWSYNLERECIQSLKGATQRDALLEVLSGFDHPHGEIRDLCLETVQPAAAIAIDALAGKFAAGDQIRQVLCLRALRGCGDARAQGIMLEALESSAPLMRMYAAQALSGPAGTWAGLALCRALAKENDLEAARAIGLALASGPPDGRSVARIKALASASSAAVRAGAACGLSGTPELETWRFLAGMLSDAQPAVRSAAAQSLSGASSQEAITALLESCRDSSAPVRQACYLALGRLFEGV